MMAFRLLTLLLSALLLLVPLPARADDSYGDSDDPEEPAEPIPLIRVAPVVLVIPSLGINADIVPVGEDPDGAMSAPTDPRVVAWWSLGYGTGEGGNVVLGGHVNWDSGRTLGVFGRLHQLEAGDEIVIVDEHLREFHYAVSWSQWVSAEGAAVEDIFSASDSTELTLITCGGAFDPVAQQYLDRLIVRALKV